MASTITKKTLTVTINETVELGQNDYGARTQFKFPNINEVSQRVVTVPTHQVSLLQLSSSAGAGTYMSSSLKYARVTNLDNENYVRLTFTSGSNVTGGGNQYDVKLEALKTFIFCNDQYSGSATLGTFDSFASFTSLKAKANSSSVDLELYIAST